MAVSNLNVGKLHDNAPLMQSNYKAQQSPRDSINFTPRQSPGFKHNSIHSIDKTRNSI